MRAAMASGVQRAGVHDRMHLALAAEHDEQVAHHRRLALFIELEDAAVGEQLERMLHHADGDHTKAEPLYIRALKLCEEEWGADHPSVATLLNYQAELYRMMGDFAKAEKIHWRALKIRQTVLGLEHPSTAQTLGNLALLFSHPVPLRSSGTT
ncbi:MAG: tetratricopeptide repeat protein, partial [Acidobacteria bacterium]|nr:tetratricopeptide repeat protein [Acidobacteriota bacterium]